MVVHHTIEQQARRLYAGVITDSELHSLENLLGIPKSLNNTLHLWDIRDAWDDFYSTHPTATVFSRIHVYADEVTDVEFNEPFDMLMAAGELLENPMKSAPEDRGGDVSAEAATLVNIALGHFSSNDDVVGLVQGYSNNSTGVAKLRQLANLKPSRVAGANLPAPRRARRLTDAEKLAFVEGYKRGEQIADLARQLGVHRTTLDMLVARLQLSRLDPNEVPAEVCDSLVEKYRAGESLAAIGEEYGFSANKVQRLLVSMGEPIRSRGPKKPAVTSEQVQQMVSRYEQGEAIASIAASTCISYAQARGCLLDAGVSMRARGGVR